MDRQYKVSATFRNGSVVSNIIHAGCPLQACDIYKATLIRALGMVPAQLSASCKKEYRVHFGPFSYRVEAFDSKEAASLGEQCFWHDYGFNPPTTEVFEIKEQQLVAA